MPADGRPVIVLCDLIADLAMRIPAFPVEATGLHRVSYLELGPGGAGNIAIMAARFGLPVACLGEVGRDPFGEAVLDGLRREGVDISRVVADPATRTPVAGVLVDARAEPAYLGYPGDLRLQALPPAWAERVRDARAVFADGWAEHPGVADIVIAAFREARDAGVPVFFDPGPGNPALDNGWHRDAAGLATCVLTNEAEALALTGQPDLSAAGQALVDGGAALAVIKRGPAGCLLVTAERIDLAPGYPVPVVDATGAGDSLAAAVIFGYLAELALPELGKLANATGAAKVQKRGTGPNMPTRDEVCAVLARFGEDVTVLETGVRGQGSGGREHGELNPNLHALTPGSERRSG